MSLFEQNRTLRTVQDVKRLAALLADSPDVVRFDRGDHKEAWALADSLAEMEKLMREFLDSELPRLVNAELPQSEVGGVLLDIGELFRRILYHMLEQQQFYQYLVPSAALSDDEDISLRPKGD